VYLNALASMKEKNNRLFYKQVVFSWVSFFFVFNLLQNYFILFTHALLRTPKEMKCTVNFLHEYMTDRKTEARFQLSSVIYKVCIFYEGTLSVPTQGVPQAPT
jgi:hypothetical protein